MYQALKTYILLKKILVWGAGGVCLVVVGVSRTLQTTTVRFFFQSTKFSYSLCSVIDFNVNPVEDKNTTIIAKLLLTLKYGNYYERILFHLNKLTSMHAKYFL